MIKYVISGVALLAVAAFGLSSGSGDSLVRPIHASEASTVQGGGCSVILEGMVGCGSASCNCGSQACQKVTIFGQGGNTAGMGTTSSGTISCATCGTVSCGTVSGQVFYNPGCGG
jgi:hypothetical protein